MTLTLPPGTRLGKPGEVIAHGTSDPPLPSRREVDGARSWDELAEVIDLASVDGHHIAGTPDTYSHGWKLRGIGGGKTELYGKLPTADKMSRTALRQHMDTHHAGLPAIGRRVGPKNPSREDLLAIHEAMHARESLSVNPPGLADGSALGKTLSATSVAHTHGVPGVADHPVTGIALSAETGRLASTPAPYGKPGGPGLYGVKGNAHSPYFEQIVKALMEKRGMDKSHASAIAWASLRKWAAKSKHVEVRAAATGGLALEKAAQARAHAHAVTWDEVGDVIDLIGPKGYVHGWKKATGASMPIEDKANVQAHHAAGQNDAFHSEMAAPGSHAHAAELRQLAAEADMHQGRNYTTMMGSREGASSAEQVAVGAGTDRGLAPSSAAPAALNRAAAMIDRGQPSLARLHVPAIRASAAAEAKGDPAYAARLGAAADKLALLPRKQGLAALPPVTPAFKANTTAARKYAALSWDEVEDVIDLAVTRVPAGQAGGGRFGSGGGGAPPAKPVKGKKKPAGPPASGKPNARPVTVQPQITTPAATPRPAPPKPAVMTQQQQYVAGVQALQRAAAARMQAAAGKKALQSLKSSGAKPAPQGKPNAQQHAAQAKAKTRAGLLTTAKTDRAKASQLMVQRKSLISALASAGGKVKKGQAGSKTAAGASKTATTAPKTAATTKAKSTTTVKKPSKTVQLKTQIAALTTQINGLLNAAATATAQAAKL